MKHSIIVGLGLAGFHYARQLQKHGKDFTIISNTSEGASRNAGGVLNPTILKRYTLAWNAELFFDYALSTYFSFEDEFDTTVFDEIPICRVFNHSSEHNYWSVSAHSPGLSRFLLPTIHKSAPTGLRGVFGYGQLKNVGKLKIKKMLNLFKEKLKVEEHLEETFDFKKLKRFKSHVEYQGILAKQIIFCEGYGLKNNPWFSYLPLTGSKGEFIHIRCRGLSSEKILKEGVFIVPIEENLYWVGATFSRDDKTDQPTDDAKQWLFSKLTTLLDVPFEVVDHKAAVRPTVQDRRPLLGSHPKAQNLHVFNGLGTRGVLMGPLLAKWLYQFVEESKELPQEVAIDRFASYFSNPKK